MTSVISWIRRQAPARVRDIGKAAYQEPVDVRDPTVLHQASCALLADDLNKLPLQDDSLTGLKVADLWRLRPAIAKFWSETLGMEADRLRDQGKIVDAAKTYSAVVYLCPWRTDLKIQHGNMVKDLGHLGEAERIYREAMKDSENDADIYLQLGHVLKLMGRRPAAIACYQTALRLDGRLQAAHQELVQAGCIPQQRESIRSQIYAHGIESSLKISAQLHQMEHQLETIRRDLPALNRWTAIPASEYDLFRRLYDIPKPLTLGAQARPPPVRVLVSTKGAPVSRLHAQLKVLTSLQTSNLQIIVIGSDPSQQAAVSRLATADSRVTWQQSLPNESEATQERRASTDATGWLLLLAPGAVPHQTMLPWIQAVAARTTATIIFFDEEEVALDVDPLGLSRPRVLTARWAFDPEILLQANVFGDSFAVRADHYRSTHDLLGEAIDLPGLRSSLLLAAVENNAGCFHLPLALLLREASDVNERWYRLQAHTTAVRQAIWRQGWPCQVALPDRDEPERLLVTWKTPDSVVPLTVIITTRDNSLDCKKMVESLQRNAIQSGCIKYLVVDNGTSRLDDRATLAELSHQPDITLLRIDEPFNWSRLNNVAAEAAATPLLLFANDDMEMLTSGWNEILSSYLMRPEVGAIGAKLLYPDRTIQHGGIIFGWQGSVIHDGLYEPEVSREQSLRWQMTRNVSAVTGAFIGLRRDAFLNLGGFDAMSLPISYSDIDLCLKVRQARLRVLWTPELSLYHHESKTRGLDHLDPERRARVETERNVLEARWGQKLFRHDPTVNPVWLDATLPFRLLRPAVDCERLIREWEDIPVATKT